MVRVFRPFDGQISRLSRRKRGVGGHNRAELELIWGNESLKIGFGNNAKEIDVKGAMGPSEHPRLYSSERNVVDGSRIPVDLFQV